jgi:hypothetical protein
MYNKKYQEIMNQKNLYNNFQFKTEEYDDKILMIVSSITVPRRGQVREQII